jgi:hypothetical protein
MNEQRDDPGVGELASLCKKLIEKGKKAVDLLAAAAAKSAGLLAKYVRALLQAGQALPTILGWAATHRDGRKSTTDS